MVDHQRPDEGQGGSATMTDDSDARSAGGEGREKAKEAAEQVRQQTEGLKDKARDSAGDLKHRAEQEVDRRSSAVAHRLESVVRALRTAADELDDDGQRFLARYARRGADQMDRAIGYLDDEDASSMLHDVEDLARSNPATFLGTTFASGVAVGRFLRSSQSHDRDADGSTSWDRDSPSSEQHRSASWREDDPARTEGNAPAWEGDARTTAVTGSSTTEVDSGMPVRDDEAAERDERGGPDGTAY